MNSKVKVCCNDNKEVIIISKKNPEWGHIKVEQHVTEVDENGFGKARKRTALIPGKIDDLKLFGWKANQEVDGKIIIKESIIPFNPKNPDYDIKIAGASGIVCTVNGQTIYRKSFFSQHPNAYDILVRHDNEADIQAAYQEIKEHIEDHNVGEDFTL